MTFCLAWCKKNINTRKKMCHWGLIMVVQDFSKLKTIIHEVIYVLNFFYQQQQKMTLETLQWGTVFCKPNGRNNSIHFFKGQHKGIEDLLNCAPMLFIFLLDYIEGFFLYTKWNHKKCKKCLSLLTSCHIFLWTTPCLTPRRQFYHTDLPFMKLVFLFSYLVHCSWVWCYLWTSFLN